MNTPGVRGSGATGRQRKDTNVVGSVYRTATFLIDRLEAARKTGPDRWVACCPAHEDLHPSLSVRELSDGKILLHCFAGCPVSDVLAAVGLELRDLFPPDDDHSPRPRERRPFPALDVLRCLAFEARVVALAAADLAAGKNLNDADRERLFLAANRLEDGLTLAEGG